jgi:hypothetical protein
VQRDLQGLLNTMEGDVLKERWQSTAGDEQWRRPRRGIVVLGEGPANMGEQGAHKLWGSAGMFSPSLNWTETDQRGVIDGGVELGSHRR